MKKLLFFTILLIGFKGLSQDYYVSTSGDDKKSGLTEATAWRTISHAAKKVKSGDTVWIKAGNYGNENVVVKNSGKKDKSISFIGYKNKPGDISSMYYTYAKGKSLDSKEMPMLDGGNREKNTGIDFSKKENIIIKNIQITNYEVGIFSSSGSDNIIENIIAKTFGDPNDYSGRGIHINGLNNKLKNCIVINASASNITVYGDSNLVENVKSYCDESLETGSKASTDYYITVRGNKNIVRGCYVERIGDLQHHGHGITLRGKDNKTIVENNLVENSTIINIKGALELRRNGVRYNTIKNIIIKNNPKYPKAQTGGIVIQGGASYNTFEKITIIGTGEAIRFNGNLSESATTGGSNNIIKNSIFNNVGIGIVGNLTTKKKIGVYNNIIENSIFYNVKTLVQSSIPIDNSNQIVNSIISNVNKFESKSSKIPSNFTQTYNDYYNGYKKPSGKGNLDYNPEFKDVNNDNFRLKSISKLIDAGKKLDDVKKDFDGNNRPQGKSHDIGAFEYQNNTTSSIQANAGKDQTICLGESVTLTASGGDIYLWSNGETNKKISISPKRTTMYTLKVIKGGIADTDTVIITVENCNDFSLIENVDIFPNPTNGILNVNIIKANSVLNLELISLNGNIVYIDKINSNRGGNLLKQINLSKYAKGVYFVKIYNTNYNMVKKILVI